MRLIIFIFTFIFFVNLNYSQSPKNSHRNKNISVLSEIGKSIQSSKYVNRPIILENEKLSGNYIIGPEIEITGLSGFYDYQTNGDCKHQVNRYSPNVLHAVFTTANDSNDISASRRVKYAWSTDDGSTWELIGAVPSIRSGFASLTSKIDGSAVIGGHYLLSTYLRGVINVDAAPGAGSFTPYGVGVTGGLNGCWPGVALLSNNNILVSGITYQNSAATDTGFVQVFNTSSNSFGPFIRVYNGFGGSQTNMRYTYAAGPNGKALYVIDALSDVGGTNGYNRIFIITTTNNGINWSTPSVLYDPNGYQIPYLGIDAIYDSSGNYYVAFNTLDFTYTSEFAALWVLKNGTNFYEIAEHYGTHGIPEAANNPISGQAGICSIDHPSLSISSDQTTILVGFSVEYENDTLNGFNKCHAYFSYAPLSSMNFVTPIKVTNSGPNSYDERYISLNQVTPLIPGQGRTLYMVYQKDPQPGSCAFNDLAPVSRSKLVFRKIMLDLVDGITENNSAKEFKLAQNYPNPFNPNTLINFELPRDEHVTLKIYDVLGREITELLNDELKSGNHSVSWNAENYPSGVYFYSIKAGENLQTRKMLLLK